MGHFKFQVGNNHSTIKYCGQKINIIRNACSQIDRNDFGWTITQGLSFFCKRCKEFC